MGRKFSKPSIGGGPGDMSTKVYDPDKDKEPFVKITGDTMLGDLAMGENLLVVGADAAILFGTDIIYAALWPGDAGLKLYGTAGHKSFYPCAADYFLGGASFRWGNLYAVLGNFSGDITVGGLVDGVDVSAHAASASAHHAKDWSVVEEIIPTETVDYIEFTGLDGDAAGSYELFISAKNALALGKDLLIYVNGDTTNANYYSQYFYCYNTTAAAIKYNYPVVIGIPASAGATAELSIRRDGNGMLKCRSLSTWGDGTNIRIYHMNVVKTAGIDTITSIRIEGTASGIIGVGSKFILCKIKS